MNSDSDDSYCDEIFIKFESKTQKNNIEFIEIGSTCYEKTYNNINNCEHDILIHFLNGDIDESIMTSIELKKLIMDHCIDIYNNDLFHHILHFN
jgi:hypothetical protein